MVLTHIVLSASVRGASTAGRPFWTDTARARAGDPCPFFRVTFGSGPEAELSRGMERLAAAIRAAAAERSSEAGAAAAESEAAVVGAAVAAAATAVVEVAVESAAVTAEVATAVDATEETAVSSRGGTKSCRDDGGQ
jgi:hypothetical protein